MNQAPNNPATNNLAAGISEKDVAEAVKKSGYPLQTIVSASLRKSFFVQDEWSYIDRDTKEQRTIDILASKQLFNFDNQNQPKVRPTLNLVIECKQSNLPFVFFLSESKPWLSSFPAIAGLHKNEIVVTSDDDPSSWTFSIPYALGLHSHAFLSSPPYSTTFSKCVRKGSDFELSGNESYNGLVFPILKAVEHFQASEKPPTTAVYFDAHIAIGLGVLDAPMIGVTVSATQTKHTLIPWVRVTRHESFEGEYKSDRSRLLAIDLIHKDFLNQYLNQHLKPYTEAFTTCALKHQDEIAAGKGFVPGMGKDPWVEIEGRLKPKTAATTVSRATAVGRNVLKQLKRASKK